MYPRHWRDSGHLGSDISVSTPTVILATSTGIFLFTSGVNQGPPQRWAVFCSEVYLQRAGHGWSHQGPSLCLSHSAALGPVSKSLCTSAQASRAGLEVFRALHGPHPVAVMVGWVCCELPPDGWVQSLWYCLSALFGVLIPSKVILSPSKVSGTHNANHTLCLKMPFSKFCMVSSSFPNFCQNPQNRFFPNLPMSMMTRGPEGRLIMASPHILQKAWGQIPAPFKKSCYSDSPTDMTGSFLHVV